MIPSSQISDPDAKPSGTTQERLPIIVRGLTAGYNVRALLSGPRRAAVHNLSFEVKPGEIIGLLGPNASGKSTVLRAIVDRRLRYSGEVLVGDRSLMPGEVAYVPQAPTSTLSPWLTCEEEIALPLRILKVPRAQCRESVKRLLLQHHIQVPLDRKVSELSGGQRVKVAVLRALAVPAERRRVVIMDEPWEGLDAPARKTLIATIKRIADSGMPVIITSHRSEDLDAVGARNFMLQGSPASQLIPLSDATALSYEFRPTLHGGPSDDSDALSRGTNVHAPQTSVWTTGAWGAIGFVTGLGFWATLAAVIHNPRLLPPPLSVGTEVLRLLTRPENIPNVAGTIILAFSWWLVANGIAIPLGIALGYKAPVYKVFAPWLSLGRCLPIFALFGVAKGIFPGHSELQTGFLIWLTLFLISLHTLSVSAAMAPQRRMDVAAVFGATHRFRIMHILRFECLSGVFAALEITMPLSIIVTLVVGMFIFPKYSLALDIYNNMDKPDLSKLFACILLPGSFAAAGLVLLRYLANRFRYEL